MEKQKYYYNTRFSADVLQSAHKPFLKLIKNLKQDILSVIMETTSGVESWRFDNIEEFYAEVRKQPQSYTLSKTNTSCGFHVFQNINYVRVVIKAPSRTQIETVFEVFERNLEVSKLDKVLRKERPIVFIGHGRSQQWRDLKDHLHDLHGYTVEAYEIGARAGHTIRDILESMLEKSSFAVLVLTGEDEDNIGKIHPRLNVVHELGLFQGFLGFSKAIALLEDGTEEFSNIHGIQQIRYNKGNIRETYGDILATIQREYEKDESTS